MAMVVAMAISMTMILTKAITIAIGLSENLLRRWQSMTKGPSGT